MKVDEFIDLVNSINEANNTGNKIDAEMYFRSIYIGYHMPGTQPPSNNEEAIAGYRLGLQLRKL